MTTKYRRKLRAGRRQEALRTDSLLARRTDCLKMVPAASGLTGTPRNAGCRSPGEEWRRQHVDQIKRPDRRDRRPSCLPGPLPPIVRG